MSDRPLSFPRTIAERQSRIDDLVDAVESESWARGRASGLEEANGINVATFVGWGIAFVLTFLAVVPLFNREADDPPSRWFERGVLLVVLLLWVVLLGWRLGATWTRLAGALRIAEENRLTALRRIRSLQSSLIPPFPESTAEDAEDEDDFEDEWDEDEDDATSAPMPPPSARLIEVATRIEQEALARVKARAPSGDST